MIDSEIYDAETDEYQNYLWDDIIDIPAGVNSYAIAKAIEFQRDSNIHPEILENLHVLICLKLMIGGW